MENQTFYEDNGDTRNILEPLVALILIFLTVLGNIVNIIVITKSKDIPQIPRYFMMSLAFADLGVGINTIFAVYPAIFARWPYGDVFCFIVGVHSHIFCSISITSLLLVSIERYISINWPLHYHNYITDKRAIIVIISMWVILESYGFLLALIQDFNFYWFNPGVLTCVPGYGKPEYRIFTVVGLVGFLVIPTIIIVYIYIRIMKISQRHSRQIVEVNTAKSGDSSHTRKQTSQNLKAAKMLFVVSGAFDIAWYPYGLTVIYTAASGDVLPLYVDFVTTWLVYSNSFWNVLIYSIMNKKFRRTALQFLRQAFHCEKTTNNVVHVVPKDTDHSASTM
ncbi:histamine H2 receptor-like [Saccoglossus kowalevskii]|uniref:Histamine H2 receptor-like n=1 Tax=Saccoglossus kowalevskii TaxID=10224 RepID=A0ABM0MTC6_SACKO|nr:PREDICTED: histamine H2 receptor-like [Saccoglossus kowalevskii]